MKAHVVTDTLSNNLEQYAIVHIRIRCHLSQGKNKGEYVKNAQSFHTNA